MGLTKLHMRETEFEQVPAGNHLGVCFLIADLGTQERPAFQGQEKTPCQQIIIGWELTNTIMNNGKPFVVSKKYNVFHSENSNFRQDIGGWLGKGFTDEEFKNINVTEYVGKGALINIVHEVSQKNGKTYANVNSITPLMQDMETPVPVNALTIFDLDNFNQNVFNDLYPWIQDIIKKSPEYTIVTEGWDALSSQALKSLEDAGHSIPKDALPPSEDDIPF